MCVYIYTYIYIWSTMLSAPHGHKPCSIHFLIPIMGSSTQQAFKYFINKILSDNLISDMVTDFVIFL